MNAARKSLNANKFWQKCSDVEVEVNVSRERVCVILTGWLLLSLPLRLDLDESSVSFYLSVICVAQSCSGDFQLSQSVALWVSLHLFYPTFGYHCSVPPLKLLSSFQLMLKDSAFWDPRVEFVSWCWFVVIRFTTCLRARVRKLELWGCCS